MVKFIADSACDLKDFPGISFETVPLTLSTADRSFVDDTKLDVSGTMDYFFSHKGRTYTACPSVQAWLDAFEGADEIYVVTITSGLSGTYNSANTAKGLYTADHPDAKVLIVDSLSTGPGEVLLLEKIVELKNAGSSFEEISHEIGKYRDGLRLYFGLASLHNLAQNGRVSKLVASAVGMLGIKVLGTASREGTIEPVGKCRGDKKLIDTVIAEMQKAGYRGGKVRICHVDSEALASDIVSKLRELFGNIDIRHIPARGLCSYYAERGGIIIGCECM